MTTIIGPIIAIPARMGFGGFRLYDLDGEPHPTGWYRDREFAQRVARRLNEERANERKGAKDEAAA